MRPLQLARWRLRAQFGGLKNLGVEETPNNRYPWRKSQATNACYSIKMVSLFRLLITLLLALSLPVQGIASTLRSCCEAASLARASVTAPAEHLAGVPHEHPNHHSEPLSDAAAAPQESGTDHSAAQHGCEQCAACCTAALVEENLASFAVQPPPSAWVSFQPPALSSHTPPIADPPPRSSRS